jgi:hypothetical protein
MFLKKQKTLTCCLLIFLTILALGSCGSFIKDVDENAPLARVDENYLYKEDIAPLLYEGMTKGDSVTIVTNYINNWASKQLLLSKAKINLPEDKLAEFDALVADYQADLYTRAYKNALVAQSADSIVTDTQMKEFYEKEKANFRLKERVVQIRFVHLPKRFLNKSEVVKRLKNFSRPDIAFLDSIGVQFKKLNFNDSIWVSASRVISEIPPLTLENQDKYLKKSQFFELEDALGVYLAKVVGVRQVNDVAPLSFIEPTLKQVLINRRKLNYIRQLETEVIDEAIKENEFEIYEQED